VKIYPRTGYENPEDPKWGGCLTPHPDGFTPENDPAPIAHEAWWATELVWMGRESLAPTGVQSSDLSACSELLY